jgi:hypothetical protein
MRRFRLNGVGGQRGAGLRRINLRRARGDERDGFRMRKIGNLCAFNLQIRMHLLR